MAILQLLDPIELQKLQWPDSRFYNKQREILYSVRDNDETIVPAGNMLGKDYITGFIVLWVFLSAISQRLTCRIVTTSVKDDHLRVLWGEIARFVATAKYPLKHDEGGPLIVNHRDIRIAKEGAQGISYLRGMVSEKGEGLAGHHADITLAVGDEASGLDDLVYTQMCTWAKRILMIGNPNPCSNFFRKACDAGDLIAQ